MTEITTSLDFPIVFIADPQHPDPVVAELEPGQWWAGNATGVSVQVCSYVDGDVTIRLDLAVDAPAPGQDESLSHSQEVETPSRKLAILSAENVELVSIDVPDTTARVHMVVNSGENADVLSVLVLSEAGGGRQNLGRT